MRIKQHVPRLAEQERERACPPTSSTAFFVSSMIVSSSPTVRGVPTQPSPSFNALPENSLASGGCEPIRKTYSPRVRVSNEAMRFLACSSFSGNRESSRGFTSDHAFALLC